MNADDRDRAKTKTIINETAVIVFNIFYSINLKEKSINYLKTLVQLNCSENWVFLFGVLSLIMHNMYKYEISPC